MAGCSGGTANLRAALVHASYEFNSSVRWGRYQTASGHLHASLRSAFFKAMEENDDTLQISMVEDLQADMAKDGRKATLRYRYHWHSAREGILRRTVVVESWHWDGKEWKLKGIRHGSGPRFPLFQHLAPPRPRPQPSSPPARKAGGAEGP